jgi:tetratricopeptide (TPR) repeat protein
MTYFRHNSFLLSSRMIALLIATSLPALCFAQIPKEETSADTARARQLLLDGQELASQGRIAEAETPLLQAASLSPKEIDVLTLLAKVQGRLGEHAEAVALFRRVVAMRPRVAENHLNLAIALADSGQLPAALAETSAALALAPRSASVHLNRARILADLHRNQEAQSEFALASKLDPENPETLYYWALLEHDEAHLAKETELLQRLVKLRPESDRDFFFLGRSLSEQSRHDEAIVALRRAVELNPHAGDALYMLAMEVKRQDPAEARSLMRRFTAVRDEDARLDSVKTLGNRAYTASQSKDWPEAIRLLRQALSECGECSVAAGLHRNLGLALCESGNLREGEAELRATLALDPGDRDAAAALGMLPK